MARFSIEYLKNILEIIYISEIPPEERETIMYRVATALDGMEYNKPGSAREFAAIVDYLKRLPVRTDGSGRYDYIRVIYKDQRSDDGEDYKLPIGLDIAS